MLIDDNKFQEVKHKYWNENQSLYKIADDLNICYYTVWKSFLNRNEPLKSHSKRLYFKEDYFENIDTHEKAYVLGFIAADGYIGKNYVQIAIHPKDIEVLEFIKKEVKFTGEIKIKKRPYGFGKPNAEVINLTLSSRRMVRDLNKLGLGKGKTQELHVPNISDEFINSFVLGYFDGDGCIHIRKNGKGNTVTIISNDTFMIELKELLNKHGLNFNLRKLNKYEYMSVVETGAKQQIENFSKFAYKDCSFSLERKREKFQRLN